MAMPSEKPHSIRLYVTHVDGEDHFLKISGQLDQQAPLMLESLFLAARDSFDKGIGAVPPGAIHEGVICAAKYKDGTYYRAKVINTSNIATGLVGVHFIDYGNRDIISLSTIRFLDNFDPMFLQLRGQATDYYLSRVIHPSGRWDDSILQKLQTLLCYSDYPATIDSNTPIPLISIQFKNQDLSHHLAGIRFGVAIPIAQQEMLLMSESQQSSKWQPSLANDSQAFQEHVPFLINQNFPSNPASAMRLQQNTPLPFNGSVPPPSLISQRLIVNKVSRNTVNLKAPARQPQVATHHAVSAPSAPSPGTSIPKMALPTSPKKSSTYKSRLLEANSQHKVFVSYAEEGPELFAVQLVMDCNKLQEMMDEINRRPHSSLAEPPMIGTVCLGRMSGDRIICRAIVMNLSGSQCKLFFVDFGDTEMVSYYDIFDIPQEFVKPNVFAMRFCLSGVKKLEKGPHLNETFKQLTSGKILTLKVVPPEGPPLIQYGELYIDNKNVLDLLMANMKDKLQFKWMDMLPLGTKQSVLVSYVDSCIKFYVQLSDKIDDLNAVMDAVKSHCENSSSPGELPVGAACCARFPDDGNWYRARVLETRGTKVLVSYVDYGNEQEVEVSDLRTITPDLIKLPAQALKCALKGFENRPVDTLVSNKLEMLILEKTLMASIVGVLSSDTMLVTLLYDLVSPPFDVARKMDQLSQRKGFHETKAPTANRKEAPETVSSPEGSQPDDRKSFRREKSFKDERRPREENPDFGQRGGSFRDRENKESFDRSGPGRHSEKSAARTERGDRNDRRGPKPNPTSPPQNAPADDDWVEESTSQPQPSFQQPRQFNRDRDNFRDRDNNRENFRDNRDRRKPRSDDKGQKPNWKKDGQGKRLRQAAEESSADAQNVRGSIQDRLKRDRFNQPEEREERNNEERGNRNRDRPDRRDNRGDRRDNWNDKKDNLNDKKDNWGDKKDSWGEKKESYGEKKEYGQKRDFKENRGERSERPERSDRPPRSNFTPRDRADRSDKSFGSEKSFKSQDSGGVGRAPPFKPRGKFTQVQYKELTDPVSLDTPFTEPSVEIGTQHEVSVTWIISPESFYTQILSLQPKFLEMMHQIPDLYKGVKPYTGDVPVGSSVLARYPADGVLYRATIVAVQPFSKFIVRYVDFGNKQLVDVRDIWQLERSLLELPKMAVHCSLIGVAPKDREWKADSEIDLCFNAPRYQCVFQECVEDVYKVSLWNNGVSVADTLVEKQLAVLSEHQSSVTLKDEPIDMTIIIGQQIMSRVTHVESFEKFYVQLDLEKAAAVEEAIASYDVTKLLPISDEIIIAGTHCTVKHDGKIYRAILQDVTDTANVQVVLPDYGNTISTSFDNLMILPTDLTLYYYQSLHCCLNNYSETSNKLMTIDELKTKLTGNKFIIYINDVDGITLMTTLYDPITGQKVSIFEPDPGAYDEVVTLCARAVFNYNFGMAYVSHAESLNEVYLQKSTDGDRLALLLDDLYKFYEEGTPEPLTSFEEEVACVAKSSDSNWYRATIISVEDTQVKVQFSDYGNMEVIPKENLKKLDSKFTEPCTLALVVSLGLVALQENALSTLVEWTTEKEVQVTLSIGSDEWLANLHLDGVDLSHKLINEKLATPKIATVEEEKTEPAVPAQEPISLPPGCTQVYISHIDTPGHFWLQMMDKVEKIDEIQAELQANADSYPDIENREMGTPCVAKYLADEQWYRAEILDADADITTVRFVDYGNTDVLDNQPGLIKAIPDNLNAIERYGVKASVNAVPTGTGEWSEASSEYFTQLVGDLSAPVDALIVLKDVTTYVDIYVNGQNLTDKLVSEGHATRTEEPECGGDLPSCFASHVNSPSEFWIQLESAALELQAMEAAMVDAENFPELKDKEEGVVCAAKYPEDGAWYRAQVIVDGSEGTEVLFMDYGNASITDELRSLPDELKAKPALSRKCALQKPRDIKTWSRRSEVKFNELAAEGATIFNVQFIASGDISIVELYLEGKSVTEELVGLCEEQVSMPIERPTPVGQDLHSNGKICYVQSLDEFYVNLESSLSDFDKVTEALANAADFESVSELKVGSVCAAFWSEDEQWYRSRILEFCDVGYHVLFIDFGNKAKCEDFRQLPEELASMEPLAKCCRLVGAPEDATFQENGRNKLDNLALEEVMLKIEFLDSMKEPMLVKIFVDDIDVLTSISSEKANEEVIEKGLPDFIEVHKPSKTVENSPDQTREDAIATEDSKVEETTIQTEDKDENVVEKQELVTDSVEESISKKDLVADNAEEKERSVDNITENEKELVTDCVKDSVSENKDLVADSPNKTEKTVDEIEKDEFADAEEMNTSQDLNESLESNHTVIENKSFDVNTDDLSGEISLNEDPKDETANSPQKDVSSETLQNSNDTVITPEREESKDSITDTGYTSDDKSFEKDSPSKTKKALTESTELPVTETIKSKEDYMAISEKTVESISTEEITKSPVKETVKDVTTKSSESSINETIESKENVSETTEKTDESKQTEEITKSPVKETAESKEDLNKTI